jgi:hypothetical protein
MLERERLITRIRQIRRSADAAAASRKDERPKPEPDQLHALETRIEHLEKLVQGFQDSVHRESSRQAKRIADLETRIQPATLGRALSDDARERGL